MNGTVVLHRRATRDIMDVADMVKLTLCLLAQHQDNDLLLVTTGHSIPVINLVETLQRLMETDTTPHLIDQGDEQRFSTEKLHRILPDMGFRQDYFVEVLFRYIHEYRELL
jgi:hypothetical protein